MTNLSDNLGGIENQHEQISKLAELVCQGLRYDQRRDEVEELLSELFQLMQVHFQDEESLMLRYGYEGLELHRRTHNSLLARFEGLKTTALDQFHAEAKQPLLTFLEKECCYHIIEDQAAWSTGKIDKAFAYQRLRDYQEDVML